METTTNDRTAVTATVASSASILSHPPSHLHPDQSPAPNATSTSIELRSSGLRRNELRHLFDFLELKELVAAARTQKSWLAAAVSLKARQDVLWISTQPQLSSLLASSLRHHVISLRFTDASFHPSSVEVSSIARAMSHLMDLDLELSGDVGMAAVDFPANLIELNLAVEFPDGIASADRAAIFVALGESIAPLQRLQTVSISAKADHNGLPAAFFQSLATIPTLTSLRCSDAISLESIDFIRGMSRLRSFYCDIFSIDYLTRLVGGDAPIPPLESLPDFTFVHGGITVGRVPLIIRLPTLTELYGEFNLPDIRPLLSGLPNLRSLGLAGTGKLESDHLVDGLKACTRLTSLFLNHPQITGGLLNACLPPLTRLSTLGVYCHPSMTNLTFLAATSPTLRHLILRGHNHIDVLEARHLEGFPLLTSLLLYQVFDQPFDAYSLATRTPGSICFHRRTWPHLTRFEYRFCEPLTDDDTHAQGMPEGEGRGRI